MGEGRWEAVPPAHRCLYAGLAASFAPRTLGLAPWGRLGEGDARDLLRLAEATDTSGIVAANLQEAGLLGALPGGAGVQLAAQRLARVAEATARLKWLRGFDEALAAQGLEVVAVKGAALLLAGCRRAAERGMGDLDLLVRPGEERARVAAVLAESFAAGSTELHRAAGGDWDFATEVGLVELHVQVYDKIGPFRPQGAALWEASVPAAEYRAIRLCAPQYVAAHAVIEYGLEGFHGLGCELRGVHDLAALLQAGLDEGEAREAARRVGCGWLLEELLPVAHEFLAGEAGAWTELWTRYPGLRPEAPRLGRWGYRRLKYGRIPGLRGKALTAWRELFPSRQPGDGLGAYLAGCARPWGIRARRVRGEG